MNNMLLAGYSTSEWRGKTQYRCMNCSLDTFDRGRMIQHRRREHPDIAIPPELDMPLEEWVVQERAKCTFKQYRNTPPNVLIGFTTWNSRDASVPAARAIQEERDRMEAMGAVCRVCWVDNHSTDGTAHAVEQEFKDGTTYTEHVPWNSGQSHSRNIIADYAKGWGADFILFVDGDVQVIPYSAYAMTVFMLRMGGVSVLGFSPFNFSREPGDMVSDSCRYIHDWMIHNKEYATCLTQFGMFRRTLFDCCRFEETGPFLGAGWGAEDDEFYIQMVTQGFTMRRIEYHNYIHRGVHTSVGRLGADAVQKNFAERKRIIQEKWKGNITARPYVQRIVSTDIVGFSKSMEKQVEMDKEATIASGSEPVVV
jgi:hypothetical protein